MKSHRITLSAWACILCLFCAAFQVNPAMAAKTADSDRYFPENVLHAEWKQFPAQGYDKPVTGVIYRGQPRPVCGMPLGGLDTGCLDIEPTGMLGYCTIFNHYLNPRLLLNTPFLGINVEGKTWLLITDRKAKISTPTDNESISTFPYTDYTPRYNEITELNDVEIIESIDYWGHFPILDAQFNNSKCPVEIGMRSFSPFIPGDTIASMLPGAVFEFSLYNRTNENQSGTLAFSFPGFQTPAMSSRPVKRDILDTNLNGLHVQSDYKDDVFEMGYVLAAIEGKNVRTGGTLNTDAAAWSAINKQLPMANDTGSGASLAYDFKLKPKQTETVRIVFSWYAPQWNSAGSPKPDAPGTGTDRHKYDADFYKERIASMKEPADIHTHMYAKYYTSALDAAQILAQNHEKLLKRVIAWQEAVYQYPGLPGWLADSLINILHLIPECSVWGQAKAPIGAWCKPEDGLFGLNECPRGCAQIECIPCSFYGNIPIVYFFPECALSTLRGYKAYQLPSGRPPWVFSGRTAQNPDSHVPWGLARPDPGYQVVLNAACYIVMADRYWRITGNDEMLHEFWDSLKKANDYCLNLRPGYGPSQVMAMPAPGSSLGNGTGVGEETEWFEAPEPGWKGYVTHAGTVRMAQVQIMRHMAQAMNDKDYIAKCDEWLKAGSEALEKYLWAGKYYLNYNEPETNTKSDLVFGYQLDGEWITDWHGLPGVFPKNRIDMTLTTLRDINCRLSQSGATNYASPDGKPVKIGGYGTYSYFPPELMMLAMNYMYEGQKGFGLDLLYKCLYNITCKWGNTWDAPNTIRGDMDTGQQAYGADYYQNMMLWAVPAALEGQDMLHPAKPGGLVNKILNAGK